MTRTWPRIGWAAVVVAALVAPGAAQPAPSAQPKPSPPASTAQPASSPPAPSQPASSPPAPDVGYIGGGAIALEVDDCRAVELPQAEVFHQGGEHYTRGSTLYLQGDYEGAVRELVYSYCLVPSFYTILKDIGQAYERNLDYEKAVGYLERYVKEVPPPGTPRCAVCPDDPQQDKLSVARRVEVLRRLRAKLYVESSPPGAQVTIANDSGVAARARSGETIEVVGGQYEMTTELAGYVPHRQRIDVRIGKPYTYFVPLVAEKGRLSMQVLPPEARIFIGDRLMGIGHVDAELPGNTYVITTEAPGRIADRRRVEVLANQVKRVHVELTAQPQFGRRQLIAFSTLTGLTASGSLLFAFQDTGIAGLGSLAGGAVGLVGSAFLLPPELPLGTSNLTVTSTIGGAVLGAGLGLVFTQRSEVVQPLGGAGALAGGVLGYVMGSATRINTGDAALINSGVVWGSVAGGLFALSFDPDHTVGGALVLSGLGMGTVGGLLLQRNFSISRTHAALIDIGGLVGMIGGLAAESLLYPSTTGQTSESQEHLANFALGGMAAGLLAAGILTRNLDDPVLPVTPAITQATASDGQPATMFGVAGQW